MEIVGKKRRRTRRERKVGFVPGAEGWNDRLDRPMEGRKDRATLSAKPSTKIGVRIRVRRLRSIRHEDRGLIRVVDWGERFKV